jgi:RNA polymerase sigma factor (sigma-70 family)
MIVHFGGEVYDLSDRNDRIAYAIKKWTPRMNKLAAAFSNPICDRDDLVQEAKLKIVNAADKWDPEHDSGTAWESYAFTAIKNAILEAATRNNYAMTIPSGSVGGLKNKKLLRTAKLTDDLPDERGDPREFLDIVDTLETFDHYRVGHMYFIERRTMHEIAELTNISRSKVARYITRMKELLRARLEV